MVALHVVMIYLANVDIVYTEVIYFLSCLLQMIYVILLIVLVVYPVNVLIRHVLCV